MGKWEKVDLNFFFKTHWLKHFFQVTQKSVNQIFVSCSRFGTIGVITYFCLQQWVLLTVICWVFSSGQYFCVEVQLMLCWVTQELCNPSQRRRAGMRSRENMTQAQTVKTLYWLTFNTQSAMSGIIRAKSGSQLMRGHIGVKHKSPDHKYSTQLKRQKSQTQSAVRSSRPLTPNASPYLKRHKRPLVAVYGAGKTRQDVGVVRVKVVKPHLGRAHMTQSQQPVVEMLRGHLKEQETVQLIFQTCINHYRYFSCRNAPKTHKQWTAAENSAANISEMHPSHQFKHQSSVCVWV